MLNDVEDRMIVLVHASVQDPTTIKHKIQR